MPPEGYTSVTISDEKLAQVADLMVHTGAESQTEAIEHAIAFAVGHKNELPERTATEPSESDLEMNTLGRELLQEKMEHLRGDLYQEFGQFITRLSEDKEIRKTDVHQLTQVIYRTEMLAEQLEDNWNPYPWPDTE